MWGRVVGDQLLDALDAFLATAKSIIMMNHWIFFSSNVPSISPQADRSTSLITRTRSSLNLNIEQLLEVYDSAHLSEKAKPILIDGEGELVQILHHLLLTSALPGRSTQTNLDTTARPAICGSNAREKQQLLQGILYPLLLDTEDGTNPLGASDDAPVEREKRHERSREDHAVGLILTSTLRLSLLLLLYPTSTSDRVWTIFDKFLRLVALGDLMPNNLQAEPRFGIHLLDINRWVPACLAWH
ncbi:hypothetical protein FRB96_006780 [Tulasnella sp. 330]|nr:hypothetical protein FRB96_006780 [Tulasnella sp. 330]